MVTFSNSMTLGIVVSNYQINLFGKKIYSHRSIRKHGTDEKPNSEPNQIKSNWKLRNEKSTL